ncbi:hypothetical protein DFH05DRAFT_1524866 [Lentinula detonsa]|uniref:RING-type domain-containing protein n=1 Tax=Lentinula detonsa TaxID=2804962 RepID=A0A9W8P1V0_9AGAR|nr:hypothetical protein DFH05DRAFT_1524866 [Lentinula detonsa]
MAPQRCLLNDVSSTMSPQRCLLNDVSSTMSPQRCLLNDVFVQQDISRAHKLDDQALARLLDFTPNTQMKNESYEVGFIRSATRVSAAKGVWWKGWLKKEDETNEPAYALRYAGCALSLFYLSIENPEDIFYNEEIGSVIYPSSSYVQKNLKASIKYAKPPPIKMIPQGAYKAVSKSANPGPTGNKGPSKNSVIIDPLALWLPPDRLGFNSQKWEILYEVICSSIDAAQIGISGKDLFKAIKKARKEENSDDWIYSDFCVLCNDFLGRVVTSCLCNKKSYCAACAVAMLKENYKNEQFRCPCCRQDPAYFIAIDWIFINNADEQKRRRALSKKQREITKKKRLREAKCQAQELAENELEEGEIRD